jgi:tRNA(adenine34) deaminase
VSLRPSEADLRFMELALDLAEHAGERGEAPVGAVVVMDGEVIAQAANLVQALGDPTAHAELLALRDAFRRTGLARLPSAVLYATLEPCVMCAGAILHARIGRVAYGAEDVRWGAFGSLFDLSCDPRLNHRVQVTRGVLQEKAAALLTGFFRDLRGKQP